MNQSTSSLCDSPKQSSFYSTYTAFCKVRNVPAVLELIKSKCKLDFLADRIKVDQWPIICKSLEQDNSLELISVRSRKSTPFVDDSIDSSDKKCCRNDITSFKLGPLIKSLSECVKCHSVLTSLALEGLPLSLEYIQTIATAISQNRVLKSLSFARSNVMDEGCNVVCSIVKDLPHIEKINFDQCYLTKTAAIYISHLIKYQTMNRNSEGWMQSLRYRDVDVDTVPGLKCLILNGNSFGDEGLELITSKLKEDLWIKAIEVQNCDLTDVGGLAILDCFKYNKTLVVFDASHNYKISSKVATKIQMILGTESDHYDSPPKVTNNELREKIEYLEQRLQLEIFNRECADDLNVQLHKKLYDCDDKEPDMYEAPIGYTLINKDNLDALYKEIEDLLPSDDKKEEYQTIKNIDGKSSDQSGFGDVPQSCRLELTTYNREFSTPVRFTPYSQDSSVYSSKLDEDGVTLTSDDELCSNLKLKWNNEEHTFCVGIDNFSEKILGNDTHKETEEREHNPYIFDVFNTVS